MRAILLVFLLAGCAAKFDKFADMCDRIGYDRATDAHKECVTRLVAGSLKR